MEEIWKPLNFKGADYSVSNAGNVRNNATGLVLTPAVTAYNYLQVGMRVAGVVKSFKVHRLVAGAFLPNKLSKAQVNHKDGDKWNNAVSNLEWCTSSENIQHSYDVLGRRPTLNKTNFDYPPKARAVDQLTAEGGYIRTWSSLNAAAKAIVANRSNICSAIKRGGCTKGYKWRYAEENPEKGQKAVAQHIKQIGLY